MSFYCDKNYNRQRIIFCECAKHYIVAAALMQINNRRVLIALIALVRATHLAYVTDLCQGHCELALPLAASVVSVVWKQWCRL